MRTALSVVLLAATFAVSAPVASASEDAERQLRAYEARQLGPEHASEHALQRAAIRKQKRRWRRMSPTERRRRIAASKRMDARIAKKTRRTAGPEAQVGRWTTAPFPIPHYAIHSVLLPTGKVMFWGYDPRGPGGTHQNIGLVALWDPSKGTGSSAFTPVPPPLVDADGNGTLEPAPIYCSGQSLLPSGEVLVAGGNLVWPGQSGGQYNNFAGINRVFTFNPFTESWTEQPRMGRGRWYPTQVEMADGRTLIMSGYTQAKPGGDYNKTTEVFTPGAAPGAVGTTHNAASADRFVSLYPHLFVLPSGNVLLAGPGSPSESAILTPQTMTWQQLAVPTRQRYRGTGVLVPGGPQGSFVAMQIGGTDDRLPQLPDGTEPGTETTEIINAGIGTPGWVPSSPLNVARANHNTVLLPDGSMATFGGGSGYHRPQLGGYLTYPDGRARQVELWDPVTRTWRLGPAQMEDRTYHSTAVLLPDGRVMSAGDDYHPTVNGTFSISDTAELFSPPYLFRDGPRPKIKRAPATIAWGQRFRITLKQHKPKKNRVKPAKVNRAVLMAPNATTHANDMQQRHVELAVVKRVKGVGLDLAAPPSPGVAPPGYYMLFALNKRGEPSIARWVKVQATAPAPPKKKKRKGRKR